MVVSKTFYFEAAHMLSNYSGECANLHGHSYKLLVSIAGNPQNGMIIDFKNIKTIVSNVVNGLDHAFLVNAKTSDKVEMELKRIILKSNKKLVEIDGRTTAENIILYIKSAILRLLPNSVRLAKLVLYETKENFVTLEIND